MKHTWTAFLLLRSQHSGAPALCINSGAACTIQSRLPVLRAAVQVLNSNKILQN